MYLSDGKLNKKIIALCSVFVRIDHICQSRDCNLVESQILLVLVETPIGVSTSRVSDWDFYW